MRDHSLLLQNAVISAIWAMVASIKARGSSFFNAVIAREATEDDLPSVAYIATQSAQHPANS
jgi:hypothetical protein